MGVFRIEFGDQISTLRANKAFDDTDNNWSQYGAGDFKPLDEENIYYVSLDEQFNAYANSFRGFKPQLPHLDGFHNDKNEHIFGTQAYSYAGYKDINGEGLYITFMESRIPGLGHGSQIMEVMQSDFDYIELMAANFKCVDFYTRHGFIKTGLRSIDENLPVMVWNR